jgi:hypothetical protein
MVGIWGYEAHLMGNSDPKLTVYKYKCLPIRAREVPRNVSRGRALVVPPKVNDFPTLWITTGQSHYKIPHYKADSDIMLFWCGSHSVLANSKV